MEQSTQIEQFTFDPDHCTIDVDALREFLKSGGVIDCGPGEYSPDGKWRPREAIRLLDGLGFRIGFSVKDFDPADYRYIEMYLGEIHMMAYDRDGYSDICRIEDLFDRFSARKPEEDSDPLDLSTLYDWS